MFKSILTLLWVFFTLFSVFGGSGIIEIYPSAFDNDIKAMIILGVNFYLSNTIAYLLGKWSTLGYLNLGLALVGTIIIIFGIEVFGTLYIFDEFLIKEWGFWSMMAFAFVVIIVLAYGGIRQILIYFIKLATRATNDTITGVQNTYTKSSHITSKARSRTKNMLTNNEKDSPDNNKSDLDITIYDLGLPEEVINNMSEIEKEMAVTQEILKRM
jgi:hypothetical protein